MEATVSLISDDSNNISELKNRKFDDSIINTLTTSEHDRLNIATTAKVLWELKQTSGIINCKKWNVRVDDTNQFLIQFFYDKTVIMTPVDLIKVYHSNRIFITNLFISYGDESIIFNVYMSKYGSKNVISLDINELEVYNRKKYIYKITKPKAEQINVELQQESDRDNKKRKLDEQK